MEQTKKGSRPRGRSYDQKLFAYTDEEGLRRVREIARRRQCSVAAVIRALVDEEAARIGLEAVATAPMAIAPESEVAITPERQQLAAERLRQMVEAARAGVSLSAEDARREVGILRAGVTKTPPRTMDPARRDYLLELADRIRRGVPEEWSDEELLCQVQEVVDEVREKHLAGHR
jgi:hypothetical protein